MMAAALGGGMHPHEASNRIFGIAVLVSIVAHAALLAAFPGFKESGKSTVFPGPITARLVEPRAAPAPAPPAPRPEAAPKPKAEEAPPPAPVVKPAPAPVAKPAPAPVAKRSPEAKAAPQAAPAPSVPAPSAAPAKPVAEPAPTAPAAPAAVPGPVARVDPQPAAPALSAQDADSIGKFRQLIMEQARRFKRYPRVAMDNNWEGKVDVRIVFSAEGRRASISVARSSGHEVLDKQALDMITKAFVPVPPALRGREFALDIPVIFNLKEASSS